MKRLVTATIEERKLVSKFMDTVYFPEHVDWNHLMPVVEKIEAFTCLGIDKTYIQINDRSCVIWTYFDVKEFLRLTGDDKNEDGKFKVKHSAKTKIQATYNACMDFILWHNSLTTKQ